MGGKTALVILRYASPSNIISLMCHVSQNLTSVLQFLHNHTTKLNVVALDLG